MAGPLKYSSQNPRRFGRILRGLQINEKGRRTLDLCLLDRFWKLFFFQRRQFQLAPPSIYIRNQTTRFPGEGDHRDIRRSSIRSIDFEAPKAHFGNRLFAPAIRFYPLRRMLRTWRGQLTAFHCDGHVFLWYSINCYFVVVAGSQKNGNTEEDRVSQAQPTYPSEAAPQTGEV